MVARVKLYYIKSNLSTPKIFSKHNNPMQLRIIPDIQFAPSFISQMKKNKVSAYIRNFNFDNFPYHFNLAIIIY